MSASTYWLLRKDEPYFNMIKEREINYAVEKVVQAEFNDFFFI